MLDKVDINGDGVVTHTPLGDRKHQEHQVESITKALPWCLQVDDQEWTRLVGEHPCADETLVTLDDRLNGLQELLNEAGRTADAEAIGFARETVDLHGSTGAMSALAWQLEQLEQFGDSLELSRLVNKRTMELHTTTTRADRCGSPIYRLDFGKKCNERKASRQKQQRSKWIGIELDMELRLPKINFVVGSTDLSCVLGLCQIRCPAQHDSAGLLIPPDERQVTKVESLLTGFECVLRDLENPDKCIREGFQVVRMPTQLLVLVSWALTENAIRVLPSTLSRIELDLWALDEQGVLAYASEHFTFIFASPLVKLGHHITHRVSKVLAEHADIAGLSRTQLQRMAETLLANHAYLQWIIPEPASKGVFEFHLQNHFRVNLLVLSPPPANALTDEPLIEGEEDCPFQGVDAAINLLLSSPSLLYQTQEQQRSNDPRMEHLWRGLVCHVVLEDFGFEISDLACSALRIETALIAFNSAQLRYAMDAFVGALKESCPFYYECMESVPESYAEGAIFAVMIPSPQVRQINCYSRHLPLAPLTVKLTVRSGALDGIRTMVPSLRIVIQSNDLERSQATDTGSRASSGLVFDMRVVEGTLEGVVASLICQQYLNSGVMKYFNFLEAISDSASHSELSQALLQELRDAVAEVSRVEQEKGDVSLNESARACLHRCTLRVGTMHSSLCGCE